MLKIKKYAKGDTMTSELPNFTSTTPWALKNFNGLMMGANVANAMLGTPKDYEGAAGSTAMAIDGATDAISNVASQFGPTGQYIASGLQANKLLSNLTSKLTGLSGMTTTDVILNRVPILGLINGLGGKRADSMQQDIYTQSQSQFGYSGTNSDINSAAMKSGKKYGMFSSGARKLANWEIASAGRKQNNLKYLIKDRDTAMDYMAGSTDLYNTGYANELMGGPQTVVEAKKGTKLPSNKEIQRAKRNASKHKFTKAQLKKAADLQDDAYKNGGTFEFDISMFQKGGKNLPFKEWVKGVNPEYLSNNYDLESAYKYLPERDLEMWKYATNHPEYMDYQDEHGTYLYHLPSLIQLPNLDYMFLKLGKEDTNKELLPELEEYNSGKNGLKETHDLVFDNGRYWYKKHLKQKPIEEKPNSTRVQPIIESHKEGGSIIPEGALHKNLNHLGEVNPELKGEVTTKGIPIISEEDGGIVQHAEIEAGEIIFCKEVTEKIEALYKKYNSDEPSAKEKDEFAIEAGKIITCEIMKHTDDKVGLINPKENE